MKLLKKSADGNMNLLELIDVFEKMCKIKIDGSDVEEELLLFEVGTYSFTGEKSFIFPLHGNTEQMKRRMSTYSCI